MRNGRIIRINVFGKKKCGVGVGGWLYVKDLVLKLKFVAITIQVVLCRCVLLNYLRHHLMHSHIYCFCSQYGLLPILASFQYSYLLRQLKVTNTIDSPEFIVNSYYFTIVQSTKTNAVTNYCALLMEVSTIELFKRVISIMLGDFVLIRQNSINV